MYHAVALINSQFYWQIKAIFELKFFNGWIPAFAGMTTILYLLLASGFRFNTPTVIKSPQTANLIDYIFRRTDLKLYFSLISFIFLFGCSTTHTQKGVNVTDKSSYITISTDSDKKHRILNGLDQRLVISSLDGKSLFRMGWDFNYPDLLHVTPGMHQLRVQYNYLNTYSNGCLWIDAVLGENYIVKKKVHEYSVMFWIENIKTNQRVGGICGSAPK